MPDWFSDMSTSEQTPELSVLVTRLLMAWICGCVVAWLARRHRAADTPDTLTLTLILMSILIAMATQIIGDNVARAFSLVGALSIVRFRTAVPATRDVAFVLASVVVGMAVGAGQYQVAAFGLLVVGLATQLNAPVYRSESDESDHTANEDSAWRVTIQTGLSATGGWEPELQRLTNGFQLTSAETARRGSAMEMIYRVTPRSEVSPVEIIAALNAVRSVESVAAKALKC